MSARMARNNAAVSAGARWNGGLLAPGEIAVIDDEDVLNAEAVEVGILELDPTLGRHYTAGPTERKVRPTP